MRVGKILRVNLLSGQWMLEEIDSNVTKMFIGGIGLASKILFEETDGDSAIES